MILSLAVAVILILLSLLLQKLWFDLLLRRFNHIAKRIITLLPRSGRAVTMALLALAGLLPHMAALLLWTLFYIYGAGAGEDDAFFEAAFYFAASTHTSLGLGDITMNEPWRILNGFQALGGLLMLAWNAAFLFEIIGRLYKPAARERG